jgi:hypothetical protein
MAERGNRTHAAPKFLKTQRRTHSRIFSYSYPQSITSIHSRKSLPCSFEIDTKQTPTVAERVILAPMCPFDFNPDRCSATQARASDLKKAQIGLDPHVGDEATLDVATAKDAQRSSRCQRSLTRSLTPALPFLRLSHHLGEVRQAVPPAPLPSFNGPTNTTQCRATRRASIDSGNERGGARGVC